LLKSVAALARTFAEDIMRSQTALVVAVLAAGMAAPLAADTPATDAAVTAVWVPQKLSYTFLGFTSKYSCDGLQDRMRRVLLKLGARAADLQVRQKGCAGGFGRPTAFPGVNVQMSVLKPADAKTPPGTPTVAAHWERIDLTRGRDPIDAAGDCELTEQIKEQVLPKFTTRNIDYSSTCIPNQLTVGGTQLKADVLVADAAAKP
jgi:hypothetical protein